MLAFMAACVRGRMNVMVSGAQGRADHAVGVLESFIPDEERLIHDRGRGRARLGKAHVTRSKARRHVEGRGEVTVSRPGAQRASDATDRIIVGEVRGGEALDMLQA